MTIRPARWPGDCDAVAGMDLAFRTDIIYTVVRDQLCIGLRATPITPPLVKRYQVDPHAEDERSTWDHAAVATVAEVTVGFVAVQIDAWTRRAIIWHLYVDASHRHHGIGTMLLEEAERFGRAEGARCLWLETQNVNYPAIQFYLRAGFRFCGCDEGLYDQAHFRGETAVFFDRPIALGTRSRG